VRKEKPRFPGFALVDEPQQVVLRKIIFQNNNVYFFTNMTYGAA